MDSALYPSMHVLNVDECNMPRVCNNVSMSDDTHNCDAFGYLRPHYSSCKLLKESKENRNLNLLEVVLCKLNRI